MNHKATLLILSIPANGRAALFSQKSVNTMERFIDIIFLIYFGTHVPIALFFDSQAFFARSWYPKLLTDIVDWYTGEYGDVLVAYKPVWFQSFIFCEMFLQFPFFFVAIYAYWKGVSKCRWIRLPMVVYSSHVVTTMICIYAHIFMHDFAAEKIGGPEDMSGRLMWASFYFPYLLVPLMLLFDSLLHPIYVTSPTASAAGKRHKTMKAH